MPFTEELNLTQKLIKALGDIASTASHMLDESHDNNDDLETHCVPNDGVDRTTKAIETLCDVLSDPAFEKCLLEGVVNNEHNVAELLSNLLYKDKSREN